MVKQKKVVLKRKNVDDMSENKGYTKTLIFPNECDMKNAEFVLAVDVSGSMRASAVDSRFYGRGHDDDNMMKQMEGGIMISNVNSSAMVISRMLNRSKIPFTKVQPFGESHPIKSFNSSMEFSAAYNKNMYFNTRFN